MRKYSILIFAIILSTNISNAAGEFIQFGGPMYNQNFCNPFMNHGYNSTFNTMDIPTNNWNNPYSYNNKYNPVSKILNRHKSNLKSKKYSTINSVNSDIEYMLSKMERNKFGQEYNDLDIDNRLDRLDTQIFGAIQSGDYRTRLNRLKRAFSAEATRTYKAKNQHLNNFKEYFSSGYPTSIPANDDYYSSLENSFSSW